MECQICACAFTAERRKPVECHCGFKCCIPCVKKYVLETVNKPQCMQCKAQWNRRFLIKNINKSFVLGDYTKMQNKLILDRERSLFPETIDLVEEYKTKQKLIQYENKIKDLMIKVEKLEYYSTQEDLDALFKAELELYNLKCERRQFAFDRKKSLKESKNLTFKAQYRCVVENCKGFLINWICNICEVHVCRHCRVAKTDEEHKCKDADIQTASMIMSSTKPCPNCGICIEKNEGCDVMWCTSCKTGFKWSSLEIINDESKIHNPYFYNYIYRLGGRQEENKCLTRNDIIIKVEAIDIFAQTNFTKFFEHLETTRADYIQPINQANELCRDLRARFMVSMIDEASFTRQVLIETRKRNKQIDINAVIDTYCTVCREMLISFIVPIKTKKTKIETVNYHNRIIIQEIEHVIDTSVEEIHIATLDFAKQHAIVYSEVKKELLEIANDYGHTPQRPIFNFRTWFKSK